MKKLSEKKAEETVENAIDILTWVDSLEDGMPLTVSLELVKATIGTLRLCSSFLQSTPYQTVEFNDKNVSLSLFNRVDVMAAFQKHCMAVLTSTCPDCGQPMDAHDPEKHDPPNMRLN